MGLLALVACVFLGVAGGLRERGRCSLARLAHGQPSQLEPLGDAKSMNAGLQHKTVTVSQCRFRIMGVHARQCAPYVQRQECQLLENHLANGELLANHLANGE